MVEISTKEETDYCLIEVNGEVDASSSIELDDAIKAALEKKLNLLIDLQNLDYISSAGLGVFISYLEEFKENERKMILFGLKPKVREVFEILGLQHIIKMVETKSEGIDAV
ncbi:MAG: STAS domain-containing protein [Cyclobacteriaceae bacterium]|tara:strand:+ start:68807 stop:69139 length:333 start_codon:yes stop_codon:yes gene_type:complete